jgi:hypothetical protein
VVCRIVSIEAWIVTRGRARPSPLFRWPEPDVDVNPFTFSIAGVVLAFFSKVVRTLRRADGDLSIKQSNFICLVSGVNAGRALARGFGTSATGSRREICLLYLLTQ